MFRTIVNVSTGEVTQVPLTEAELTALQNQPQPVVVASCTPWQIRKALNILGLRSSVEFTVATSENIELKDGWEFASEFRSNDPFVLSMGATIGKTPEEIASLVQWASTL